MRFAPRHGNSELRGVVDERLLDTDIHASEVRALRGLALRIRVADCEHGLVLQLDGLFAHPVEQRGEERVRIPIAIALIVADDGLLVRVPGGATEFDGSIVRFYGDASRRSRHEGFIAPIQVLYVRPLCACATSIRIPSGIQVVHSMVFAGGSRFVWLNVRG